MNARAKKRLENRQAKQARQAALVEEIKSQIQGGKTLTALRRAFTPAVLTGAFGTFSLQDYDLLDKALGPSASEHKILIDECVNPALLPHAHQHLGVTHLSSLVFGKSVKDPDLFPAAIDSGYRAILSSDAVSSGKKALCGIAKDAYADNQQAPHIILLPQDISAAIHALRAQSRDIQGRLANPFPHEIYDTQHPQ